MKNLLLIAVLLLVGNTYGQNYTYPVGLYSYETLSTVSRVRGHQNVKVTDNLDAVINEMSNPSESPQNNYNYPVGLINYNALQNYNKTEEFKLAENKAKNKKEETLEKLMAANRASRENIVIRKAPKEVLVRYEGKHSSLKLFNINGEQIKARYSKKYRGLIIPRDEKSTNYFLEVKNDAKAKTYYHQVSL